MALAAGNTATWSDVSGIYSRVVSERNRWGRSTSVSGGGAGSTIMTAHGQSLRNAMVDLVNNISYLSGFRSSVTGTANITQGALISVPTLTTLRSALNGMRTVFGYIGTGAHFGTYGTGFSGFQTSFGDSDTGDNSVWSFFTGGCFGHSGDYVFSFTVRNDVNNYCANCSSGYYNCSPYCTAGYCSSYFNAAL